MGGRRILNSWLFGSTLLVLLGVMLLALTWAMSSPAIASIAVNTCEPLQVTDRRGRLLRAIPADCNHRGRALWVPISDLPQILRDTVITSEDQRFYTHMGVDLLAISRAAVDNLQAGQIVSGASTITMQLMRMVNQPKEKRGFINKIKTAWQALKAERTMSKSAILEAYFNHAYYGQGAYGIEEAAQTFFGKEVQALTNGEATLLAILPRAPTTYDPSKHLKEALKRRCQVLNMMVAKGRLDTVRRMEIEAESLHIKVRQPYSAFEAPHFVDWVLTKIPENHLRSGGWLTTTLDLELQHRIEKAVADHVRQMRSKGVKQAGVVVLDAQSSQIRALIGSSSYTNSQVNITSRRRHPGSILKPFVYALAIEAGASPSSLAFDVGDMESSFRAKDWIGREGGPMRFSEALAGSYNFAAIHLLEQVGVNALRDKLQKAGVAEASMPPEFYGLKLVLGSARVRLMDVAAGFGFLVRQGMIRRAHAIRDISHRGKSVWRSDDPGEVRLFSPEVSWLTMNILSDPSARHRRFGRGLPVEGASKVVAKTGTASGLSDVVTVLASREWIVGAWVGRFDGQPTKGMSGMWAAAPLARLALDIALQGKEPTLPDRPSTLVPIQVCPLSGQPIGPHCPSRMHSFTLQVPSSDSKCTWHRLGTNGVEIHPPPSLKKWASRARVLGVN